MPRCALAGASVALACFACISRASGSDYAVRGGRTAAGVRRRGIAASAALECIALACALAAIFATAIIAALSTGGRALTTSITAIATGGTALAAGGRPFAAAGRVCRQVHRRECAVRGGGRRRAATVFDRDVGSGEE